MNDSPIVLDRRLCCVMQLCSEAPGVVADIGTDHGLLPVALLKSQRAIHCFACDISEASLQKARTLAVQHNLSDKLSFVVTDGLLGLPLSEIDTITVCGMGADRIIAILDKRKTELLSKRLVLQPNSKEDKLRKYLVENGFEIAKEQACSEGKHLYIVMQAEYTASAPEPPSPLFFYVGKVDKGDPQGKRYLEKVLKRRTIKYNALKQSHSDPAQVKQLEQLIEEISDYFI